MDRSSSTLLHITFPFPISSHLHRCSTSEPMVPRLACQPIVGRPYIFFCSHHFNHNTKVGLPPFHFPELTVFYSLSSENLLQMSVFSIPTDHGLQFLWPLVALLTVDSSLGADAGPFLILGLFTSLMTLFSTQQHSNITSRAERKQGGCCKLRGGRCWVSEGHCGDLRLGQWAELRWH